MIKIVKACEKNQNQPRAGPQDLQSRVLLMARAIWESLKMNKLYYSSVALIRSNIQGISSDKMVYVCEIDILGTIYSVYTCEKGGYVRNEGSQRGYINWAVYGQNHQTDDFVMFD